MNCSLLDRTSVPNHDRFETREGEDECLWKNNTKGTFSESQQKSITAHIRENQFAEYWMGHRESLLNRSTGRFVMSRLLKRESRTDDLEKMD
jgi:hypothetical protein